MRLAEGEDTPERIDSFNVYVNGELLPTNAIIEANEEAFYAVVYELDKDGFRKYKSRPDAPIGEPTSIPKTKTVYGTVEIKPKAKAP